MIPVDEAKSLVAQHTTILDPVPVPLENAAALVLAEDLYAKFDIPAFPQSSMDGYAFKFSDWQPGQALPISAEIPAGIEGPLKLTGRGAARIFTGAPVPSEMDTVVMQEKTTVKNGKLFIEDLEIQPGRNVRPKGSEIKAGELALPKNSLLTPAAIGFLAGVGIPEVSVYRRPRIKILVTGNELQQPGKPLAYAQVYESNSYALRAALDSLKLKPVKVEHVRDDASLTTDRLRQALEENDVILLCGGVSVGDYDLVVRATEACGVKKIFHKVKQRPGKPLYFGKIESTLVFGLPGNPSSVLTCFYEYVLPALEAMMGKESSLKSLRVLLAADIRKNNTLTQFMKGWYDGKDVTPLGAQESYRMSSFARANCLIRMREETIFYEKGTEIEIHVLPIE